MGFDCTLHLVDEKAIREQFVPRLLGKSKAETVLDQVMENASELWSQVQRSLKKDKPYEAASLVCQLAVTFSACSLPHQYERGFALSMWADQEAEIAVEYPQSLMYTPERLFGDIVAKYPALRGQFPMWFTGNYSTGVFIPSEWVPEVLSWVEEKIAKFSKGKQRRFKGLLRILRAAMQKNLAYWEATDLAVPMMSKYAGDPKLMLANFLGNEPGQSSQQVEEAPIVGNLKIFRFKICDKWLVFADSEPFLTNFWDLSAWPPREVYSLTEFAPYLAYGCDDRWLLFSETNAEARPRTFRPRLFSDLKNKVVSQFPVAINGEEQSISKGGFFGDRPIVFPSVPWDIKVGSWLVPPLWHEDNKWVVIPGLPTVAVKSATHGEALKQPVVGTVRLGDGSEVVIWLGDGYELVGNRFKKTFSMKAKRSHVDWQSVPAGSDGFFYLSNRCLFEVHRNAPPRAHAEKWTNIMSISPGPAGSLLLKEGENDDGDVAKLYFPTDGTFIHIEPELFDDKDYTFIYWSEASDRFLVVAGKFLSVRTAIVLSLPRFKATTGKQVTG